VSPTQADGIAAALALWQSHGAPGLGSGGDASIEVRFAHAAEAFHGFYDGKAGVVYINEQLAGPSLPIVIAHELGHAFGLVHVSPDVRPSLMNPGNVDITPTDDDQRALESLWGACAVRE
jgi:hypothetical protein